MSTSDLAIQKPKSPTVTQSNILVEASYRLNLEEKRIIIAAISKIDSRKGVPEAITITAEEYAKLFEIDINSAYQQMIDASAKLFDRTIRNLGGNENKRTRWIYDEEIYKSGEGKVVIRFSPNLHPYLGMLKEQFTAYRIENVRLLKSSYAIRMFELLTQFSSTGHRYITLDKFRDMLDLNDKYPRFADLKRWVIEPSISEITEKSTYEVSYRTEKKGRKIHKLIFSFTEKEQLSMEL